jgi:hypothetical protein
MRISGSSRPVPGAAGGIGAPAPETRLKKSDTAQTATSKLETILGQDSFTRAQVQSGVKTNAPAKSKKKDKVPFSKKKAPAKPGKSRYEREIETIDKLGKRAEDLVKALGGERSLKEGPDKSQSAAQAYQKLEGVWKLGNKVWADDWIAPK